LLRTLRAGHVPLIERPIEGQVLQDNTAMLNMCEKFGFVIRSNPEAPYICDVKLSLSG
jgi:acetyltransferase